MPGGSQPPQGLNKCSWLYNTWAAIYPDDDIDHLKPGTTECKRMAPLLEPGKKGLIAGEGSRNGSSALRCLSSSLSFLFNKAKVLNQRLLKGLDKEKCKLTIYDKAAFQHSELLFLSIESVSCAKAAVNEYA